ncbi:CAP domain-containing protein [Lacticigenium naphthae]|uniref:CAP domain-containing protein n=1 Tax=Lacticigenium naphthae TaxID=515351 RepID=UPI0004250952|nr:CAP domain-containing protein [Lacticigenium naphthae]
MGRFLLYLLTIIFSLLAGIWIKTYELLDGTQLDEPVDRIIEQIPVPEEWKDSSIEILTPDVLKNESATTDTPIPSTENKSSEINYEQVEESIFEQLNQLREEKGLPILTSQSQLKVAGDIRAKETEESFSHTRPDGRDPFTVLKEDTVQYNYRLAGENLGMATYFGDEESMAKLLFEGWRESQGHYENMIHPDFREVGIGIHFDGEILYATQIFGTPM